MNWEEVGAVGQVLGSIAVLVTLVYLSIEVRHARQEMRRSIALGRATSGRELCLSRVTSERLCALRAKSRIIERDIGRTEAPARFKVLRRRMGAIGRFRPASLVFRPLSETFGSPVDLTGKLPQT